MASMTASEKARRRARTLGIVFCGFALAILVLLVPGTQAGQRTTFGFTQTQLIYLYMVVQVSALVGAFVLAKPTDTLGPKRVLSAMLVVWVGAACSLYFITSQLGFAVLAIVAGFGLGSVQAASRAFMASLIPDGREAEMFGFYALCGKSSSVLGPIIFGQVAFLTGGNQRLAVMAISVLFIAGLILLQRVDDPKAAPRAEAVAA